MIKQRTVLILGAGASVPFGSRLVGSCVTIYVAAYRKKRTSSSP